MDVKRNKWHLCCGCKLCFGSNNLEPKHVFIGLFKVTNTSGMAMAPKLQELLNKFTLTNKIIIYVKDEGSNLQ